MENITQTLHLQQILETLLCIKPIGSTFLIFLTFICSLASECYMAANTNFMQATFIIRDNFRYFMHQKSLFVLLSVWLDI